MQMNNRLETWSDFASFRMRGGGLVSLRHDISPGIEVGLEEPTSSLPIGISIAQNTDLHTSILFFEKWAKANGEAKNL